MSSWLFCRKESHLRGLGLLETEVVVVTLLDHGEVDSVPKGVGAGETDTDGGGKVSDEPLSELANNRSDGHCDEYGK